jgi:hypothetical protein
VTKPVEPPQPVELPQPVKLPQYLFLMRHAEHRQGHLTKDGSAHVRGLAERLSEWMQAEWRCHPKQTIRLWYTTQATEVQETADLLTREVLSYLERRGTLARRRFGAPDTQEKPAVANDREDWLATLPYLPTDECHPTNSTSKRNSASKQHDLERVLSAYTPDRAMFRRLCSWLTSTETGLQCARRNNKDSALLVGNDPLIGWLAAELSGRAIPVARGELICLVREADGGGSWRLLWTISEDREEAAEAIRAKIKSKMTTAGALGTVIVGLTTFLLQDALQKEPAIWHWLAFTALGASAALYFAALFLYDTLQMPTRFWTSHFPSGTRTQKMSRRRRAWSRLHHGKPALSRPPSSTARVLQTSMMQIWRLIFTPATVLAGIGVALFAVGATSSGRDYVRNVEPWHVLVVTAGLAMLVAAWVAWQRPNLGSSD